MKAALSSESSQRIVNLSFFASVAICATHVRWFAPDSALLDVRLLYSYPALVFFFAVSGYFLARHDGEPGWWRTAVRKRIGTIVIPFCVWQLVNGVVWFFIEGRWSLRPGGFGLNPFIYPNLAPLWYLRNLMLLVVASPLVFWCVRRWGGRFLATVFAVWLVVGSFMAMGCLPPASRLGGLLYTTFTLHGFFGFSLGAWLAWHPMTLSRRMGNWCGAAALALAFVRFALKVTGPVDVLIPATCLTLAFAWTQTPAFRLPKILAQSPFPIYLVHGIILNAFCWRVFPQSPVNACLELLLGVGVPIVFSALLHRHLPRVARLAFGGR